MSCRLGVITVGQSPRQDVIAEMQPFLGPGVEVIQAGALDGLNYEDVQNWPIEPGDYVLVSSMRDGRGVKFAEKHILPRLQGCIDGLEEQGVQAIVFICTGAFPDIFHAAVPLIYPQALLRRVIPELTGTKKIGVFIPEAEQIPQTLRKWYEAGLEAVIVSYSPYDRTGGETLPDLEQFNDPAVDLVVMDCIGYTAAMKEQIAQAVQKPVILARTFVARILGELG